MRRNNGVFMVYPVYISIGKILSWTFCIIMCIKLIGLFTETLVCVIVNDPLVLFITFLMYPVLPTHVFVDRFKMCIGKGGRGYFQHVELSYWFVVWNKASNWFLWSRIDLVYILAAWNNCTPPFHRWFFCGFSHNWNTNGTLYMGENPTCYSSYN